MTGTAPMTLHLPDPAATIRLGERLAARLGAGDVLALEGPIGAGKSLLARALIQTRLAEAGRVEDIPSPSFTLVQTYEAGPPAAPVEIWHCDLYRLGHPDEVLELGLDAAFDQALCLIEWPDRLGADLPHRSLTLRLAPGAASDTRTATFHWQDPAWGPRLDFLTGPADAL